MENKNNDKRTFIIMTALLSFIFLTIIVWGVFDYLNTGRKLEFGVPIVEIIIAIITAIFAIKLLKNKYESIKSGEPLKDERLRKIETKAAAYAFYIGIYWLLALSFIVESFKPDIPSRVIPSIALTGMVVIFGLAYWYLNKKGE